MEIRCENCKTRLCDIRTDNVIEYKNRDGVRMLIVGFIVMPCPNEKCKKVTIVRPKVNLDAVV